VNNLCFTIRQWVVGSTNKISFKNYSGNGVSLYRYDVAGNTKKRNREKLSTAWFKECIEMFKKGNRSNIILTWTNKCSEIYNNEIRKILFNKTKVGVFEIGDILILNDFYCFGDGKETSTESTDRFYTSEQIKITELHTEEKIVNTMSDTIPQIIKNLSGSPDIIKKFKMTVNKINKSTKRVYTVWKMGVIRLSDNMTDDDTSNHTINVIHDSSAKQLTEDSDNVVGLIKMLSDIYQNSQQTHIKTIERYLMKPLWNYWDNNFVAQFADVIFGYSITTHKAQGSTFNNVFVDADDILKNSNDNESKRCIYTAITRCSNEIHILA